MRRRYAEFRAREIEFYKQVVPHRTLMRLADLARQRIETRGELVLGEVTLAFEVDDVIVERLRMPSFTVWSRRQFRADGVQKAWSGHAQQLTLLIPPGTGRGAVLLLQPRTFDLWEAVCASGRNVVMIEPDDEARERVLERASRSGWSDVITAIPSDEKHHSGGLFASVFYSPAACADLADWEADELIESLKARTDVGGVHVVDGLLRDRASASRAMLRRSYSSWRKRVQRGDREWTLIAERQA